MDDFKIYGFMGNIGVGKDYIAKNMFIKNQILKTPFLIMAFADHFKIQGVSFENMEFDKVYGKKDDKTRQRLQKLGTELGRDRYGDDIWIKVLDNWIKVYRKRGISLFVITDVRHENEANYIKSLGGKIIKIEAEDRNLMRLEQESNGDKDIIERLRNHITEKSINEYKEYDYVIDNSIKNQDKVEKNVIDMIYNMKRK